MGKILDKYFEYAKLYKDYMPKSVNDILNPENLQRVDLLQPDKSDREKFFVEGYEDLSLAIFNLLHSGRGYYIVNYVRDFDINRKASGFKTVEDLVHYAKWVINDFMKDKDSTTNYLDNLKEYSKGKTDDEMMRDMAIEQTLTEELKNITYNMKSEEDMVKRLAIIEYLKDKKTLAYHILTSYGFYQIMDDILIALDNIPNVDELNVKPKPLHQNEWEKRTV